MESELSILDQREVEDTTPVVEAPDPTAEKQAALDKREAELKAWEKKLNKESTELGLTAKQLAEQQAAVKPADDEDDFDPEQLKVLKKALKKLGVDPDEYVPVVKTVKEREAEEFNAVGDEFFSAHDDVTPEELFSFMGDMNITPPKTAARLKTVLNSAYKAYAALKADPEAKATEMAAAKLAELADKGEKVVQVKPKRSGVSDGKKTLNEIAADPTLGFWEKAALLEQVTD